MALDLLVAHLVVPAGDPRPGRSCLDRQPVLEPVDLHDVVRVGGIDQYPGDDDHIGRVELVDRQRLDTGVVDHAVHIAVLVHDHDGQVAATGVGDGDTGALADVGDGHAVEGVPVHPDDRLLVDGRRAPDMGPVVDPGPGRQEPVGLERHLGPGVVVDSHLDGHVDAPRQGAPTLCPRPARGARRRLAKPSDHSARARVPPSGVAFPPGATDCDDRTGGVDGRGSHHILWIGPGLPDRRYLHVPRHPLCRTPFRCRPLRPPAATAILGRGAGCTGVRPDRTEPVVRSSARRAPPRRPGTPVRTA